MAFLGSFFRSALAGTSAASSEDSDAGPAKPAASKRPIKGRAGAPRGRREPAAPKPRFQSKPTAALVRLHETRDWSDAEIVAGEEERVFPVHAVVVAMASPYLHRALFDDDGELKTKRILLPDADPDALEAALRFCYTDSWGGNATLVLRLRRVARLLEMKALEAELHRSIEEDLSASDAVGVMQAAAEEKDTALMAAAVDAALSDPSEAIKSPSLPFLTAESLAALVSHGEFAAPELDIVLACFQWAARKAGTPTPSAALPPPRPEGSPPEEDDAGDDAAATAAGSAAAAASAAGAGRSLAHRTPALTKEQGEAVRAALEPLIVPHLRFPLLSVQDLAKHVKPWGVLTPSEMVQLLTFGFKTRAQRAKTPTVARFLAERRSGHGRTVLIHLWGAGGASGQDSSCARGGAGGYMCVQYVCPDDEELSIYVGAGGYTDASSGTASFSTQGWPNGGRGGYSWNSGGGGGATFVVSRSLGSKVLVGAGGGGGGTAPRSWACGGGGGGGTKDGKVGSKGDGGNQPTPAGEKGVDGNGDGGPGESSGSGSKGADNNGAGGDSASGTRANGGAGGHASFLPDCDLMTRKDARSEEALTAVVGGRTRKAGRGGRASHAKERGKDGLCIIEDEATGKTYEFNFERDKSKGKGTGKVHVWTVDAE